jgi:hypothetical protein
MVIWIAPGIIRVDRSALMSATGTKRSMLLSYRNMERLWSADVKALQEAFMQNSSSTRYSASQALTFQILNL